MSKIEPIDSYWINGDYAGRLKLATLICWPRTTAIAAAWVAGPAEAIKGLAAQISGGDSITCRTLGNEFWLGAKELTMHKGRLPKYNTWQMFLQTTDEKFLLAIDPEAVDRYLLSNRFTTPMLPEWTDWVSKECFADRQIVRCETIVGMVGYKSVLNSQKLDVIVSRGIKSGAIRVKQ